MRKFFSYICLMGGLLCCAYAQGQVPSNVPQRLAGKKIAIDPGHGGHDSDDRQTPLGNGYTYWESDGVWETSGYLEELLLAVGASVKLTKTNNDPSSSDRDPALSERVAVANAYGADYMHSVHTNAGGGAANYSLVLWRGVNDTPTWSNAKVMGDIMSVKLYNTLYTTAAYSRADRDFLPYYLGVLAGTNMPATLSEGSFHDYIPEGKRMKNSAYLKSIAWSMLKSFFDYFGTAGVPYGELGGIISDDSGTPLNNVTVTLNPGTANAKVFTGDAIDNGFYFFDWLDAGSYTVKFEKAGYVSNTQTISVSDGGYTKTDITLNSLGSPPARPLLSVVSNPSGGSSVYAAWQPNGESNLLGYRLYYAEDDALTSWKLAADENSIGTSATSVTIGSSANFVDVPTGDVYHFRLRAVADAGSGQTIESEPSDIYSRSSNATGDAILIVDGFDRTGGSYSNPFHSFATNYFKALRDSRNVTVATCDNANVADGTVVLGNYTAVFWFLGDESTVLETFADAEQTKVIAYLENGGQLFVSGSEIGWDLDNKGTTSDQSFFNNYLKANYVDDGASNYTPATGISGSAFDGVTVNFGITYPEDYPDDIDPMGGATAILNYAQAGRTAGVAYTGTFGSGSATGGVVYVSFPVETASLAEHTALTGKVLDYFGILATNVAPVAQNDNASTNEGVAVNIDVLANDTDANNNIDASTLVVVSAPSNGTASVVSGQVQYSPTAGYTGSDSFTYRVSDSQGAQSNVATVLLTVSETVLCLGDGPEVTPSKPKKDMRGAWLSTVYNIDWPSSTGLSVAAQKAELISLLDGLKDGGINAVFLQVRPECDALYASTIDPWSYYLTGQQGLAPSPFYDPLEFAIDEAHQRGMELHAWLNPYRAKQGTPSLASSHVANQHPDWVMSFSDRDLLNPGIPAVRNYLVSVINDIASRYDVDGIHYDDYFYPYAGMGSEDASAYASYNPNSLSLADWRRDNVNQMVAMTYNAIQSVNTSQGKNIKFGISPFGIWKSGVPSGISGMSAYDQIYCDALAWLTAGTVDYLSPQLYWAFGGSQDYASLSTWWDNQVATSGKHHYPGLAVYRLADSGWPASYIQNMIDENRLSGNEATLGQLFFTTKDYTDNTNSVKSLISADEFLYPSYAPSMDWKEQNCPNPPADLQYSGGNLVWSAPAAAGDGDLAAKYVVYRFSTAAEISTHTQDGTKVKAIVGGTSVGLPAAWLTGADNYFVVSALDKNNNESGFSNTLYLAGTPQYCAASGNNSTYEWISEVKVGTTSKTSGNDGGYGDKTAQTFDLTIGNSYSLTLVPGYSSTQYNENWKVWVDLNKDGDFEDSGELLFSMGAVAKNTVTGSITVPISATAGATRMRVGMNGSSADYTLNSCGSFAYGEVEDYTVNLYAGSCTPPTVTELTIDNGDSGYSTVGTWTSSTSSPDYIGTSYYHEGDTDKGNRSATYTPDFSEAGDYLVEIYYAAGTNRATNVPVDINHISGTTTVTVNQQEDGGVWNSLGTYSFDSGTNGNVTIRNTGTNGVVIADAIRFTFVGCTSGARVATATVVEEIAETDKLILYPNPVQQMTTLGFTLEKDDEVQVVIYDMVGRVVSQYQQQYNAGNHRLQLNTSALKRGIYLIKLNTKQGLNQQVRMLKD
ncbi:family 10 glycosylhydrolase [Limibacter armeniacum]|uniref:family 10 glycosylhydrolase n=1 Tax=Limibacter armeniacum TaxID=466084 RepID=UPI002FE57AED